MTSFIARGGYLITPTNDQLSVIEDGAVFVEGGVITDLGPYSEIKRQYSDAVEIGSREHLLLPGLVNAHSHGYGITSGHRGTPARSLELGANRKWLPGDADPYWDTLYTCARFIESGVTTVVHSHPNRYPENYEWRTERTLQAYRDAGLRVAFAVSTVDQNNLAYESDAAFLKNVPIELATQVKARFSDRQPVSGERFFKMFRSLHEKYDRGDDGRVRILLAPVGPQWCSDELLNEIRTTAQHYKTGIHIHLLETAYQKQYGQKTYGKSPLAHLADLGILGENVSFAHGVWLTERDAQLLGETNTSVVHNPSSNLRLGSGLAPIQMLKKQGVNVAIGTDSSSLNEDEDYWTEMRLAQYLHRFPGSPFHDWPDESQILTMATRNGAQVALFQNIIGTLEKGKRADLILVRLPAETSVVNTDSKRILRQIVARSCHLDVEMVVVDGELLLQDGELIHLDRKRVTAELQDAARNAPKENVLLSDLMDQLQPYIADYFGGWDLNEIDPIYLTNSRI